MPLQTDDLRSDKKPADRKRRSLFSFLFIPDFRPSVTPIGQTANVFVEMLALLFVMYKMFPKDHPGFNPNSGVKLRFMEVMRTAYSNVSFTRERMPQALFFLAVCGCMGFAVLAALVAFASIMMGRAHAGTMQFFTPFDPANDMGQQFINYLFQGTPITTIGNGPVNSMDGSSTSSTIIQCGLYTALGFYSDAILVIAAMVLFYHLAWMTVETAHHGQVMGRRGNQVWAPIRLVFAVGLLVPIGGTPPSGCTTGGTGLNAGQMIVIAIAQWGNGLASQVWETFLVQLANDKAQYVAPAAPPVRKIVDDLLMDYACQWDYNWYVDGRQDDTDGMTPNDPTTGTTSGNNGGLADNFPNAANTDVIYEPNPQGDGYPSAPTTAPTGTPGNWQNPYLQQDALAASDGTPTTKYVFTNQMYESIPICGAYIIPGPPKFYDPSFAANSTATAAIQNMIDTVYNVHQAVFSELLNNGFNGQPDVYHTAVTSILYFLNDGQNGNYQMPPPQDDIVNPLVAGYQQQLGDYIESNITAATATDPAALALAGTFGEDGWITAGAWFNRIARVQTDLMVAGVDALPKTRGPALMDLESLVNAQTNQMQGDSATQATTTYLVNDFAQYTKGDLYQMKAWLNKMQGNAPQAPVAGMSLRTQMELAADEAGSSPDLDCHGPMDCIFWGIDHDAGTFGVWHSVPASLSAGSYENLLGVQFTGANPLAEIANYGNALLELAYASFDRGIEMSFIGGVASGVGTPIAGQTSATGAALSAAGAGISGAGSVLISVGTLLFTLGFMMAYFLPLIPFIAFFFGVIAWIMSMLEAVVMAPLVALAHLNPQGDGLPGEMARGSYFLIFQVFLRPVLMVFGLLCGMLVFYLAVTFLNAMFAICVAGTGGLSHGHYAAARLIYTTIYVLLCVIAANHSFDLISRLPNISMTWLGGQGSALDVESVAALEGKLGAVGGYLGGQAAPQLASSASQGGNVIGAGGKAIVSALTGGGGPGTGGGGVRGR